MSVKIALLQLYLERVMSWLELGNVHPLAIDIMLVNVTAINGNTLVPIIGAFVSEMVATLKIRILLI